VAAPSHVTHPLALHVIAPTTDNLAPTTHAVSGPDESLPIDGLDSLIESILRQPQCVIRHLKATNSKALLGQMVLATVVFAAGYGLVVGSFAGGIQWWAAPLKVTGGMLAASVICLPSLYIFACLGGSSARFGEMTAALGGLLTLQTLLLIGFAPAAWLFSQSTRSEATIGFLHLAFWFVAFCFGVRFLFSALRQAGLKSEAGLKLWVLILLLVSLQMTSALRPLIGRADTLLPDEKKFFVEHWSENLRVSRH
jgi:hypothetical protein